MEESGTRDWVTPFSGMSQHQAGRNPVECRAPALQRGARIRRTSLTHVTVLSYGLFQARQVRLSVVQLGLSNRERG